MKKTDDWLCLVAILIITLAIIFCFSLPTKVSFEGIETETALAQGTPEIMATSTEREPEKEVSAPTYQPKALLDVPQVLLDIAWCESRDDQSRVGLNYRTRTITLEDGSTTTEKYVWSRDIGRFQINDYYHAETAKSLGFDIYTVEGNTQYALLLYNTNSTRDWNASKPCWSDIEAWKAKEQSYY